MDWLDLSIKKDQNPHSSYYFYNPNHIGLSTLENLGNTCFFNSVIQCLCHTMPLTNFILKGKYPRENKLFTEYAKLVKTMWYGNYKLTPNTIYSYFTIAFKKNNSDQEDAHEVLLFMLNHFHDSMKYNVVYKDLTEHPNIKLSLEHLKNVPMSPINNIFMGQLHQRTQCRECKHTSHTFPTFIDIILPLTNTNDYQSIYHLLNNFCHRETLENEWNCDNCNQKKVTAFKKTTFWRLPQVLVITLGRFNMNGGKNTKAIDYPIRDLDLTKYLTYPDNSKHIFNLFAVSCHVGTTQMGHYYTITKINHEWVILNDESVDYINRQDDIVNNSAYILFYQRNNYI
jgi:ubiquitin carboxyl-terminal hydrolase 8